MGIYIPGLVLPHRGNISIDIFANGLVHSRYTGDILPDHAVEVPPHGRLGDLDEIERYKERLVVDADKIKPEIRYVVDTKYIKDAPTIIPAEEAQP